MPRITALWLTDPVQFLVQDKFPETRLFKEHSIMTRSDRQDLRLQAIDQDAATYLVELKNYPDEDISQRVKKVRAEQLKSEQAKRDSKESLAFFNLPRADADYQHWAKASYWTNDEFAALLLGKDPRLVKWKSQSLCEHFAIRKELSRQFGPDEESCGMKQLFSNAIPGAAVAWASATRS